MGRIFVGNSEYQSLKGKPQYLEERAGLQFLAVLAIVNAQLPASERVTINEGERPRPSQLAFWNDYRRRGAPPAAVAAAPYLSKHDGGPNGDNAWAADLGGPGGSVISDRAHALVKSVGAAYGIHHTGATFRPAEKWHFQYVPGTATKLASAAPTEAEKKESVAGMIRIQHEKRGIALVGPGYFHGITPEELPWTADVITKHITAINERHFDLLVDMHLHGTVSDGVGPRVWAQPIDGYNGPKQAGARLAGIDQKAGTAKLDASGLVVKVDEASIVSKVQAAVKAMFTNGGK
jgi:hypothetical protein